MLSPFKPFVMQNKPQRLLNVSFRVQSGELCVRKGRGRGGGIPQFRQIPQTSSVVYRVEDE